MKRLLTMKRLLALFLALILSLSFTACGSAVGGTPEGLTGEIGGEITVSCYDTMMYQSFLEEAAGLFEAKYPGTKVNIETFSAMPEIKTSQDGDNMIAMIEMTDDPQGQSDYISKVSTALMSGQGADIYAADVLPLHKFAESGQMEELSEYMESDTDFDLSDYRTNILDAVKYKGGLWFVPLEYSFNYYTYDSTLIGDEAADFGTGSSFNTEQLIQAAASAFDGSTQMFGMTNYVKNMGGGGLYASLLSERYRSFVDIENKQANFTDGGFADMLNSLNEYANLGYVSEGVSAQMDADAFMRSGIQAPTERYFFKPKNNFSLLQFFNRDSSRRMNAVMTDGDAFGIEDDDEIAGIQADAKGLVPFTYHQGYAMNAASKNKQTAWAFLKFLLGEEMQTSANLFMTSLPLHNEARAEKAEMLISGSFMERSQFFSATDGVKSGRKEKSPDGEPSQGGDGSQDADQSPGADGSQDSDGSQAGDPELDEAQKEVLRQYTAAIERLSDQINTYAIQDATIDDMIAAEVQYFFDGVKTAEDVAQVLQNKVELYLNE